MCPINQVEVPVSDYGLSEPQIVGYLNSMEEKKIVQLIFFEKNMILT